MSGLTEPPDINKAHKQWNRLKDIISQYADIEIIEPQPDLPDMVFTANAGTIRGQKIVLSNFRFEERQKETALFEKWFEERFQKAAIFFLPYPI